MVTETKRVMVAVHDDTARTFLTDNLQADGYEPVASSCLGHARSRLCDRVDALIVNLGVDTIKLADAIRADLLAAVDAQLPIIALIASNDRFHTVRLLERGADDVISEPWSYVEVRARLAAVLRRADVGRRLVMRYVNCSPAMKPMVSSRSFVGLARTTAMKKSGSLSATTASYSGKV
jgi:DNA-binding response OmpR family regulator